MAMSDDTKKLAEIESFDPRAFLEGPGVPQSVCDFILTLAVIFNDIRDTSHATLLLEYERPQGGFAITKQNGEYSGIAYHLLRVRTGIVHELLTLIHDSEKVLLHESMTRVVGQMSRSSRDAWRALVNIANGVDIDPKYSKIILWMRNKVIFHYDSKAIRKGFRQHFVGENRSDDYAYVSRGDSMGSTRYYFADAAAYGFLRTIGGEDDNTLLQESLYNFNELISDAMLHLITQFIQYRKCVFRQYRSGSARVVKSTVF